uniref:Putative secreted protein n=1 Tax=Ixodes ricinus TaxID=34613 RepID=A0A6B0TV51_IXORI
MLSMSGPCTCSTLPVLLFLNTTAWLVILRRPDVMAPRSSLNTSGYSRKSMMCFSWFVAQKLRVLSLCGYVALRE